jgi:hypothetical protein
VLADPSRNDYRPCLGCRRQWKIDIVHGRRYALSIFPPGLLREFRRAACRLRSVNSDEVHWPWLLAAEAGLQ